MKNKDLKKMRRNLEELLEKVSKDYKEKFGWDIKSQHIHSSIQESIDWLKDREKQN